MMPARKCEGAVEPGAEADSFAARLASAVSPLES